ncbi:hypothetical protein GCM10023322_16060 [Rugosimonospora acidiphila]|uniref:Uncharacterized protein n=2 Tax=Rugosimonospora acidiphila TaxID=556531 RepID=A0ABP9RPP0_9ACTN
MRWLGAGAGVLALGVSGIFGGLKSADPGIPQLKPNVVSKDGPWNVSVIACRVVDDLSPLHPATDGDRWFIVLANVDVTADNSQSGIGGIIRLPNVAGLVDQAPDHVLLSRDGSVVDYLNPGMTERIGFVWEQSSKVPVPTQALVQVYGATLRDSSLTGDKEWLDSSVRATVLAPVQDRRT